MTRLLYFQCCIHFVFGVRSLREQDGDVALAVDSAGNIETVASPAKDAVQLSPTVESNLETVAKDNVRPPVLLSPLPPEHPKDKPAPSGLNLKVEQHVPAAHVSNPRSLAPPAPPAAAGHSDVKPAEPRGMKPAPEPINSTSPLPTKAANQRPELPSGQLSNQKTRRPNGLDYALPEQWLEELTSTQEADLFYIHPNTAEKFQGEKLTGKWLTTKDSEAKLQRFDALRGRFNIMAPQYRQTQESDVVIMGEAANDIMDAFDYYIEHNNNERPIVVVGEGRGADILDALLKERFSSGKPRAKLVAAYSIGDTLTSESNLPLCDSPQDVGCLAAWSAVAVSRECSAPATQPTSTPCVNPLTWHRGGEFADPDLNLGSRVSDGSIVPGLASAKCTDKGLQVTLTDEHFQLYHRLPSECDLKDLSYDLFATNVEANIEERLDAFGPQEVFLQESDNTVKSVPLGEEGTKTTDSAF